MRWTGAKLTPVVPSADTAVLSHARLRSNSTGARHSSRPLDAGRGRRLGGPRDPGPEKPRTSPGGSGGRVPKSASVSALSLIITAGDVSPFPVVGGGVLLERIQDRAPGWGPCGHVGEEQKPMCCIFPTLHRRRQRGSSHEPLVAPLAVLQPLLPRLLTQPGPITSVW